jgi:hypothetical protein
MAAFERVIVGAGWTGCVSLIGGQPKLRISVQ